MNKLFKVMIAILGAVNTVYGFFIPIAVALITISVFGFRGTWTWLLVIAACLTTLYRAIDVAILRSLR